MVKPEDKTFHSFGAVLDTRRTAAGALELLIWISSVTAPQGCWLPKPAGLSADANETYEDYTFNVAVPYTDEQFSPDEPLAPELIAQGFFERQENIPLDDLIQKLRG